MLGDVALTLALSQRVTNRHTINLGDLGCHNTNGKFLKGHL